MIYFAAMVRGHGCSVQTTPVFTGRSRVVKRRLCIAVKTGREHGPVHGCSLHTTHVHGPCWRPVITALFTGAQYTLTVFTGRVDGPWSLSCSRVLSTHYPCSRAVLTGR